MSLIQIFQTIFASLSGPLGAALIGCILVVGFIRVAAEHRLHYIVYGGMGGAGVFTVAWIMSTMMGVPAPG